MSLILDMSSGDSVLAILIGLLGAFLLHVASKLLETSVPFHVSLLLSSPWHGSAVLHHVLTSTCLSIFHSGLS